MLTRVLLIFVLPIAVEIAAAMVVSMFESGAYADGFAAIVVLVMLIIAIPLTIFCNMLLVYTSFTSAGPGLLRAMIAPVVFIFCVLIYYTGLWDKQISPLFPETVEFIQPAGSGRMEDGSYQTFFTVHGFEGTTEELQTIEKFAQDDFDKMAWGNSGLLELHMTYYFVPTEKYDPIDYAKSRNNAIAVFRHAGSEDEQIMRRIDE